MTTKPLEALGDEELDALLRQLGRVVTAIAPPGARVLVVVEAGPIPFEALVVGNVEGAETLAMLERVTRTWRKRGAERLGS
jgi:hypothetical protein